MSKNPRSVWLVFACLLATTPSLLFAGPWEPNRSRPPGFQRTLGYLEPDLHNYPVPVLQQGRNTILNDDLTKTLLPQLQRIPTSGWEAEGQKAFDAYGTQYEAMKDIIRQTMNNGEAIISAVENHQRVPDDLAAHQYVQGLIVLKWQRLNVAEQTYQALLYAGLQPRGGGGRPPPPGDWQPPKPAKSKHQVDWERMRERRQRAIERRQALEARWQEEARRRLEELNALIAYLRNHGAQSTNKFQATRPGVGGAAATPLMPALTPLPAQPAGEPPQAIEEIEQIEGQMDALEEKMEATEREEARKEVQKVRVHRGTFILKRPSVISDDGWGMIKQAFIDLYARDPEVTDLHDKGDEVTWRYRSLVERKSNPYITVIPDGEPTGEEVEGEPAGKPEDQPPAFVGNGDADTTEKDVPGSGPAPESKKPAAPAVQTPPKPAPAKPEPPKPVVKQHDGYWYDPGHRPMDEDDPTIYVRFNGQAVPVKLSRAGEYNVPDDITIDQMSWYSERFKRVMEDRKTHRPKKQ